MRVNAKSHIAQNAAKTTADQIKIKKNEIKTDSRNFKNAMEKAIAKKPFVKCGKKDGQYFIAASDGFLSYAVQFVRASGGKMLGSCLCAGGRKGYFFYHLAAAFLTPIFYVVCGLCRPAVVAALGGMDGEQAKRCASRAICASPVPRQWRKSSRVLFYKPETAQRRKSRRAKPQKKK